MTPVPTAAATVETCALGFIVTFEGYLMPKMLPGHATVFHGRVWAQQFADAINADDTERCHELIAKHGRVYAFQT